MTDSSSDCPSDASSTDYVLSEPDSSEPESAPDESDSAHFPPELSTNHPLALDRRENEARKPLHEAVKSAKVAE